MWLHPRGACPRAGGSQDPHSPSPLAPERPLPQCPSRSCLLVREAERDRTRCSSIAVTPPTCFQSAFSLAPSLLPSARCPSELPRCRAGGSLALQAAREGAGRKGAGGAEKVEGGGGAATWCHGHPGAPEPVRARGTHRGSGGRRSCRRPAEELPGERVERAAGGARGGRARASQQAGE